MVEVRWAVLWSSIIELLSDVLSPVNSQSLMGGILGGRNVPSSSDCIWLTVEVGECTVYLIPCVCNS